MEAIQDTEDSTGRDEQCSIVECPPKSHPRKPRLRPLLRDFLQSAHLRGKLALLADQNLEIQTQGCHLLYRRWNQPHPELQQKKTASGGTAMEVHQEKLVTTSQLIFNTYLAHDSPLDQSTYTDVGVHIKCGSGAGGERAVDCHLPDRRRVVRAPREQRADARQQRNTTARASSTGGIFKKVVKHNPRLLDLSTITHHPARSTMYHQSRPNLTSASNLPIIPLPLSPESSTLSFHHRKPSPSTPSRATISSIKPLHRLPLL
ncbi:hypothetical protein PCANC_07045 [Puccinia coronata f. sp. avenae]|uniref:Uncharacterized protein n=1 Tax=Puccinia coronata f. sp. avenae TaxID=200324 RepID=A0A2N5VZK3_9BASI|nr:hypothetical protein PCANC_07045 [Puccinia coronata f. sp. avenae]